MKSVKSYQDGFVDTANRVIMDESGVTKLDYPRFAKAAELAGAMAIGAMLSF